jgi:hypothetical protein
MSHALKARQAGGAAVELALILPFLLAMVFIAVDFSRAIQANNILVNMAREGANLMSRNNDTPQFGQYVMNALGDTAMPSYMGVGQNGTYFEQTSAIVMTRLQGKLNAKTGNVDATVTEQYKWLKGGITPTSQFWNCSGGWNADGSCRMPATPPVIVLRAPLADGDIVYAVEAFHNGRAIFGGMNLGVGAVVPAVGPVQYAFAMF